MICVIALVVFGILGIFSAKHRRIAKDALNCVFKRITLRKCDTGLDKKLKAQITGKLLRKAPRLAGGVYKHFEVVSWAFVVLLFVSLFFLGQGVYNLAKYGSCDPHSEFCMFNPSAGVSCGSVHCEEFGCSCGEEEVLCTPENNFAACGGDCDCFADVCGANL
jgi:hypothetical protein